ESNNFIFIFSCILLSTSLCNPSLLCNIQIPIVSTILYNRLLHLTFVSVSFRSQSTSLSVHSSYCSSQKRSKR
ncbi:hypothetical protein BJ165DRAFT_1515246, partial [Panaeolus papilionaceus]